MTTVQIEQFERLLKAVADRGQAAGLEAAARILDELAAAHMRVVGTSTIKEVAAAFREEATKVRGQADVTISSMEKL